jgi:N-formylglutamate deformylase
LPLSPESSNKRLSYAAPESPRPDFCIGTDIHHTPPELVTDAEAFLTDLGCSVAINKPYSGTLVPLRHYGQDSRVASVMIEVNRRLYMDESTGEKSKEFGKVRSQLSELLGLIKGFER